MSGVRGAGCGESCVSLWVLLLVSSLVVRGGLTVSSIPSDTIYLGPLGRDDAEDEVRMRTSSEINVTVLLPFDPRYKASVRRTGPAIQLGFKKVKQLGLLPNHRVRISYIDSNCSNIIAPLEAMRYQFNNAVHVFFGPSCELALGKFPSYL